MDEYFLRHAFDFEVLVFLYISERFQIFLQFLFCGEEVDFVK